MTHLQPKFSIITITYNAEQWLERTILSVLSQSYTNVEYIVIDGASTDRTVELIKQYEAGISYWVSEPDQGLYDAMNKGLRKATGDYVWFLNAGDTLYTADTLQSVVASLKKSVSLPDVLYGETQIVDAQGRSLGMRRLKAPRKLTWKRFRMGMLVCHQSFVVKRSLAPEYDTTYRWVADYEWCIRCLKQAKRPDPVQLFGGGIKHSESKSLFERALCGDVPLLWHSTYPVVACLVCVAFLYGEMDKRQSVTKQIGINKI